MANELKTFVVNLKSLDQDIADPIVAGAGDANGRTFKIIFTQEAAAQLDLNTKVYLKWHHKQENVHGYNVFTHIQDNPTIWQIRWPQNMLHKGDVHCIIDLVDDTSIAQSTGFTVHVLEDAYPSSVFETSDDFTVFQNAAINMERYMSSYIELKNIKDYLYEAYYLNIDYEYAAEYFNKSDALASFGGCSSVRNNNFYGRNFDWFYNENAEFIVHTPQIADRYAVLGVASNVPELTNDIVKSRVYKDSYRLLPFFLVDGINEKGVIVNINTVPQDKSPTIETIPLIETKIKLSTGYLVRYVLDHFSSAASAVEFLQNYAAITVPATLRQMHYEVHFMIADYNSTYLLELINNRVVITNMTEGSNSILDGKSYMTNFYLSDVVFDTDNKIIINRDNSGVNQSNVTLHGEGLERYNLIVDNFANANTKDGMRQMMQKLKYTKMYTQDPSDVNNFWFTEYASYYDVTASVDKFTEVIAKAKERYNNRSRKSDSPYFGTFQSVHSCVYDMASFKLYIIAQEDEEELEFQLLTDSTDCVVDNRSIVHTGANAALSIKNYLEASQGYMLVKDNVEGLTWVRPVSDESLQEAVRQARESATQAGTSAVVAGNYAAQAIQAAQQVENKFWYGTIEEYNNLETVSQSTIYIILDGVLNYA